MPVLTVNVATRDVGARKCWGLREGPVLQRPVVAAEARVRPIASTQARRFRELDGNGAQCRGLGRRASHNSDTEQDASRRKVVDVEWTQHTEVRS